MSLIIICKDWRNIILRRELCVHDECLREYTIICCCNLMYIQFSRKSILILLAFLRSLSLSIIILSIQQSLRRFRSWSQDRLAIDNPAGASVDSTQNASISRASYTGAGGATQSKSTGTKVAGDIEEPYLDDDELKPLIYGYLHKLGRNGHWQRRFFETSGEGLTYYKSVKRTKVLATLDLCKVSL